MCFLWDLGGGLIKGWWGVKMQRGRESPLLRGGYGVLVGVKFGGLSCCLWSCDGDVSCWWWVYCRWYCFAVLWSLSCGLLPLRCVVWFAPVGAWFPCSFNHLILELNRPQGCLKIRVKRNYFKTNINSFHRHRSIAWNFLLLVVMNLPKAT